MGAESVKTRREGRGGEYRVGGVDWIRWEKMRWKTGPATALEICVEQRYAS
jgi:hypothetical protein